MRLLARVYANSNTPSKVSILAISLEISISINYMTVVVEFHEAKIHGQVTIGTLRKISHVVPMLAMKSGCIHMYKTSILRIEYSMTITFLHPLLLETRRKIF